MTTKNDPPSSVSLDYIKSELFRVVHIDGAICAVNPRGTLGLTLFCERLPIPRHTEYLVNPDGTLGAELSERRDVRNAIVRQPEICAILDIDTAKAIAQLILNSVERAQAAQGDADPPQGGNSV